MLALALSGSTVADGPEPAPFPYGELAALAAAEAPRAVRITLREAATAHERPGGNWPVVARVRAGRQLVAIAATPGGAPWLRVRLRTGRVCWLRSAAVEVTAGRIEWLPLVRAPVLLPVAALMELAAAEAAPRILLRSDALVRLRPALDWPVLAEVEAGKSLAATAITPGGDPWLRVELADGEAGWIQLAATNAPDALIARLPFGSARPITTDYALLTGDIRAWARRSVQRTDAKQNELEQREHRMAASAAWSIGGWGLGGDYARGFHAASRLDARRRGARAD